MNESLTQKLIDRFDFLKPDFYFEVSDGWFNLLWNLMEELEKTGFNQRPFQIKEKFGGLRFYTGEETPEQYEIINKYEFLSFKTCQKCGTQENDNILRQKTNGWIVTLCNKCF